jgi:hypothetical protein
MTALRNQPSARTAANSSELITAWDRATPQLTSWYFHRSRFPLNDFGSGAIGLFVTNPLLLHLPSSLWNCLQTYAQF